MKNRKDPGAEDVLKDRMSLVSVEEANNFKIGDAIHSIYKTCPFLGYTFSSLKRYSDWDIPTAAISSDNKLYYNPRFMASSSTEEQKYVLFHECLHKIHNHFGRSDDIMKSRYGFTQSELFEKTKKANKADITTEDGEDELAQNMFDQHRAKQLHQMCNYAEDIAINQYCDLKFKRIPIGVHLDEVNKEKNMTMEAKREWEYYLNELEKDMKENPDNWKSGDGEGSEGESKQGGVNSHDVQNQGKGDGKGESQADKIAKDGNLSDEVQGELNKEAFKNIIRRAKQKQKDYEAGSGIGIGTSDSLLDVIPDLDVKVNDKHLWKYTISKRFGTKKSHKKELSLKRPSRRYAKNPFGKSRQKIMKHNVVIVDTSGSCMNVLDKFFGICERACKRYGTSVDLLFCTSELYAVYKNQNKMKIENYEVHSGGTDLTQAQRYIMENYNKDVGVICITDGYTDWLTEKDGFRNKTSMIYTKDHTKLDGIKDWAVIEED